MPSLQRFDAGRPLDWEKVWQAFDDDGGAIFEQMVAPDLLARLQEDFAEIAATHTSGTHHPDPRWHHFHGVNTKRITGLPVHSSAWPELMCDPRYQAIGDRYLGANDYQLNTGQLICLGPGETAQPLHRDEGNWLAACGDGQVTITANFALTDFTEENGATVVAPGSHKWDGPPVYLELDEALLCRATMPAGSAMIYVGKLIHGGGANTTRDEWRLGLHSGFCKGWLRPEENHQLTVPLEVAKTLPERAQYLLGFRSYMAATGVRLGLVNYDDAGLLLD